MAIINIQICQMCGTEFKAKSAKAKWCSDCAKKQRIISARRSYYKKIGSPFPEDLKNPQPCKKVNRPMFKWKGPKTRCSFDGCPFKSGNKPCLFYFEYKDGTASCPGKRFMKGSDRIGLEKRSD